MDYKSIKIADEIILVEKQAAYRSWVSWREVKGQGLHQAYVVDAGNKKMLESAHSWADDTVYDESLRPSKAPYNWDKYYASGKKVPGIDHTYQNGQFELTLCDSADNSSQGGKLAFWNCIIKCPDGKEFLVGINADILLELLVSNTFVNGTCQSKVWLGRIGGKQVGAFTENMPLYAQAQKDEAKRQEVKSAGNKYIPGDIVKSLKEKDLYLGSVYKYYEFEKPDWGYREKAKIIIYDKPKLVHIFRYYYYNSWKTNKEELSDNYEVKDTKPKRIIDGHVDLKESANEYVNKYINKKLKEYLNKQANDPDYKDSRYSWDYAKALMKYGESSENDPKKIKEFLKAEYKKHCSKWYHDIEEEYDFITEAEWKKLQY